MNCPPAEEGGGVNQRLTRTGKKVVELTGDATPDARALREADVVTTTPEKWDGVSRQWRDRSRGGGWI
jgi:replicative superfamily II helicase